VIKQKISEANSGQSHAMWGKHHSEETKKKMSIKKTRKKDVSGNKNAMSRSRTGKKRSPDAIKKPLMQSSRNIQKKLE